MLTIGERLREERERLGMSQTEFGSLADVTKATQINYEAGRRAPDVEYLAQVATVGVDVRYVITGERALTPDQLRAERALYADCWAALDAALQAGKKRLNPEKKRAAVDALFDLARAGEGEVSALAAGFARAA